MSEPTLYHPCGTTLIGTWVHEDKAYVFPPCPMCSEPLSEDQVTILRRRVQQAEGLDVVMSRADMLRLFATLDSQVVRDV